MLISTATAFLAGLISFLAPCVLPLIPGFLAYLAGGTVMEAKNKRREIFLNSLFFVLGFSLVFALLGVLLNTLLEAIAYDVRIWLSRIGGAIIIFFGLSLTGLIKLSFLEKGVKLPTGKIFTKSRYLTSFLFGLAFAAGWTPCVGPVLGAILGLAASAPGSAFTLLMAYALGLGLPFLIIGAFTAEISEYLYRLGRWLGYLQIVFGIILIVLGILVFTDQLARIANFDFVNNLLLK